MSQLTTQWITSTEGFHALKAEWNELLVDSRCNTLFLTWEWLYTWWSHLAEGRSLFILTVRAEGRLIAVAPLTLRPADYSRMVPFRVMEMLGAGSVGSDYLSVIVRSGEETRALAEICAQLISRKFVLEMHNTESGSSVMSALALQMKERGCRTTCHTQNFSPCIDLSGYTWSSYLSRAKSSNGVRYQKRLRKLQRTFVVSMTRTTREEERSSDLETMIELHLKRWSGRGGTNAFASKGLHDFHEAFSGIALQNDWLRLFLLRLDGAPAAAVYGFYYLGVFYYYQAGFDPQFNQYSLGHLAIGMTVEQALAEGAREYDLLHGDEEYKYAWATGERELVCRSIYPPNVQGYLCARMMEFRNGVKTLIHSKAPESVRERLHPVG